MRALSYLILRSSQLSFGALLVAALTGCEHRSDAVDAGAAATPSSAPSASAVNLAPLGDTPSVTASAGPTTTMPPLDTHPATTAVKPVASAASSASAAPSAKPATATAQAQLRQCCAAIRKQAQKDAAQAVQLNQAAAVCDGLVAAIAPATTQAGAATPGMPQLDAVKAMLGGAQLPPVCQGL